MNEHRSGGGPDDSSGSWATEALPMSVRKQLLERELHKLGIRKPSGAGGGASTHDAHGGEGGGNESSHPQATDEGGSHGG